MQLNLFFLIKDQFKYKNNVNASANYTSSTFTYTFASESSGGGVELFDDQGVDNSNLISGLKYWASFNIRLHFQHLLTYYIF